MRQSSQKLQQHFPSHTLCNKIRFQFSHRYIGRFLLGAISATFFSLLIFYLMHISTFNWKEYIHQSIFIGIVVSLLFYYNTKTLNKRKHPLLLHLLYRAQKSISVKATELLVNDIVNCEASSTDIVDNKATSPLALYSRKS